MGADNDCDNDCDNDRDKDAKTTSITWERQGDNGPAGPVVLSIITTGEDDRLLPAARGGPGLRNRPKTGQKNPSQMSLLSMAGNKQMRYVDPHDR